MTGSYEPPVLVHVPLLRRQPPNTIMRVPVHTAECSDRADGAFVIEVGVQWSATGSYRAPVLVGVKMLSPPQMIISVPVQVVL